MDETKQQDRPAEESNPWTFDSYVGSSAGKTLDELAAIAKLNHMSVGKLKTIITCNHNTIPDYINQDVPIQQKRRTKSTHGQWEDF